MKNKNPLIINVLRIIFLILLATIISLTFYISCNNKHNNCNNSSEMSPAEKLQFHRLINRHRTH